MAMMTSGNVAGKAPAPVSKGPAPKAPVSHGGAPSGGGHPASTGGLLAAARAMASGSTAGPLSQLASEIAANNAQTANAVKADQGYFKGLGNFVNQDASQVGQVGSNLDSQLANLGTSAQNSLMAYSPKGDPSVGQAGMPALTTALAEQRGLADSQQASYSDLAHMLGGAYALQGQQDIANERLAGAAKGAPLAQKFATEEDKNSALTNEDLVKLTQQEQTNQLKQEGLNIQSGKLNLAQYLAGLTAKKDTAAANAAAGKLNFDWAQLNAKDKQNGVKNSIDWLNAHTKAGEAAALDAERLAAAAKDRAATGATGSAKPLPTSENTSALALIGAAGSALRSLTGTKGANGKTLTRQEVVAALQRGNVAHVPKLPLAYIQAALEMLNGQNTISHNTWTELRNTYGIHNFPFKVAPPSK